MLNDKQDFYTEFINNKMKNPRHFCRGFIGGGDTLPLKPSTLKY